MGIASLHPSYETAVIASEAKQSISQHQERMDCFAALAMTPYHAAGCATLSSLESRWISELLIAACRVGAVICAPSKSVT